MVRSDDAKPTRYERFRAKLVAAAEPTLAPDEQIEWIFGGQTKNPWLPLISVLTCLWLYFYYLATNRFRLVVATDRRILVLDTGCWTMTNVKSIVRELPRSTKIGAPAETLWFKSESVGEQLYIHKRFYAEVRAIDASGAIAQPETLQPPAVQEDPDHS